MVFLDSLYGGSEGETAFLRCCNFLTCATEEEIDWSEWQLLIIPEDYLPQQLNFHDCGMCSIKWAEHIAFGIPMDFQQDNMEDFRYATILSLFAQKLEVDYQYCKVEEAANPKNITQFTTPKTDQNTMSQMTKPKVYETRTNDVGHNTMHQQISNPPVAVLDHNYAKTTDDNTTLAFLT